MKKLDLEKNAEMAKGTMTINLFDIRKASWVWMTNIVRVYRTNLWHTTAVRKFIRLSRKLDGVQQ